MSVKSFTLLDSRGNPAGGTGGSNTAVAMTSCTAASPIVITAAAHGFLAGDLVKIISSKIVGLDGVYNLTAVTANTFTVTFDNSLGGTAITGVVVSMMAVSTASAIPGSANTQDKAIVVATFKQLSNWDEVLMECIGSAVNTATLTFDWVIQRPIDPAGTKWEDYVYFTQANNTAIDNIVLAPAPEVISSAVQAAAEYAYKDTSKSVNGTSVTPGLTATDIRPGHWGNALRLVIVPRAASMDGTHFLVVQVLLRGIARA